MVAWSEPSMVAWWVDLWVDEMVASLVVVWVVWKDDL